MCGIVGAARRQKPVTKFLLNGLKALEYRGYDSAGVATLSGKKLARIRAVGRVAKLQTKAKNLARAGTGIGHTRWATHGAPTEANAHPIVSLNRVAVVHNGIIENYMELKAELEEKGFAFNSDTDTEVIAHLIEQEISEGKDLLAATKAATKRLTGAYAIAVIAAGSGSSIVCARIGSPLLIGIGKDGSRYLASDPQALIGEIETIVHLNDGDCAEISFGNHHVINSNGKGVQREAIRCKGNVAAAELGNYRHFMEKEIHEQPEAVSATIKGCISGKLKLDATFGKGASRMFGRAKGVTILACGTSYHAGLVARYWIEGLAKIPCQVEVASEYRYRSAPAADQLVVAVSQSGETADTLAATQHASGERIAGTLAICNVETSALPRLCKLSFLTQAGPEIGVASTKAFTTQLAALYLLAVALAHKKGKISGADQSTLLDEMRRLPFTVMSAFQLEPELKEWAAEIAESSHALYIGRGPHYPIALEGALKLKEISYVHAEGYPGGELKHGPLALIDKTMPVIGIAADSPVLGKVASNLSEVTARGGKLFVVAGKDYQPASDAPGQRIARINVDGGQLLSPVVYAVPMQLLAYHAARKKGTDIDKPRNLAKSVTVE